MLKYIRTVPRTDLWRHHWPILHNSNRSIDSSPENQLDNSSNIQRCTWCVSRSETVACSCRSNSSTKGAVSPACVVINLFLHCRHERQWNCLSPTTHLYERVLLNQNWTSKLNIKIAVLDRFLYTTGDLEFFVIIKGVCTHGCLKISKSGTRTSSSIHHTAHITYQRTYACVTTSWVYEIS